MHSLGLLNPDEEAARSMGTQPPSPLPALEAAGMLRQKLERDQPVNAKAWLRTTWCVSLFFLLVSLGAYWHYCDEVDAAREEISISRKNVSEHEKTMSGFYAKLDSLFVDCNFVLTCVIENSTNFDLEIGRLEGYIESDNEIIMSIDAELQQIIFLRDMAYKFSFLAPPSIWILYFSFSWVINRKSQLHNSKR